MTQKSAKTLYDKIWDNHFICDTDNGDSLIYIDLHLIHEVTTPQAFAGLRANGRKVAEPSRTLATADHNTPTEDQELGLDGVKDPEAKLQLETLSKNVEEFGIQFFPMGDVNNGIVHVVGPEQGRTQPGLTIVCGDSHTSTHGAFAALAHGIGTSEVEHVLATQTLRARKMKNMAIKVEGELQNGVTAKDVALAIIAKIGTAGGTGSVIEFMGSTIGSLSMEGRMTLCNMAIEAGARAGLVAADEKTFEYIKGRPAAPKGGAWEMALKFWQDMKSDDNAFFDIVIEMDGTKIKPMLTWGTNPEQAIAIDENVPTGDGLSEGAKETFERALNYVGFEAGQKIEGVKIDRVFIGSCTNSRIEDLREAAEVAKNNKVANSVRAMVVPGSGLVKLQAEEEGLDKIFKDAGFEWREPGCSMCLGMNPDKLAPGERCASTSNRNFEGRQGRGSRTHLCSPRMAAWAAIKGELFDYRNVS
ncbi:MAG: 3-isopropylmalate dehydratase large subunit [Caulobacterales bacterium]|nr:3-isopropylmalate dehydratase large subunit [Caulobacterales bacterium]MCA0371928.1 3-isopropylmalate dehydratase large subunit [Pseudomonadota bacterium]